MPLKKLTLKPGVNRENTRYMTEGGWYSCDNIRFRQGNPEKIGGWLRRSAYTYLGVCRSLFMWITLSSLRYIGVGTHLKFYVDWGGKFYDITPLRSTEALGADPFATTITSPTVTVTVADTSDILVNDFVTFSGATAVAGLDMNAEFQVVSVVNGTTFTVTAASNASATTTGGGATVTAKFQINTGPSIQVPTSGWGAGPWGSGTWGVGTPTTTALRTWSQSNFGEDLIFGPRYGGLYYFDSSAGLTTRAVNLTSLVGASDVPTTHIYMLVSDVSRFVIAFGCNDTGSSTMDPLLIRWSDQEDAANWTPAITNQAGGIRLSNGSEIVTALQVRQEILVLTDSALYSMQYLGAPLVWGTTLLADNTTIVSPNAVVVASGVVYWMGDTKFYVYDGQIHTLSCDLRQYVFSDFNMAQAHQVYAGLNEGFNEVWWFYCSADSTTNDRYVVYNYLEKIWYYGSMARTAWLDTGPTAVPVAATYSNNLVYHETGLDDGTLGVDNLAAITASITSSEFDIDDGHNFAFVQRVLPDMSFTGSTAVSPSVTMTLLALTNSGSGYNNPESVGGNSSATVTRTATAPVQAFTGQVYVRLRGRQMSIKVESTGLGVQWQFGAPRIDLRPDGRAGGTP